jgi:hypothetical protein
MADILLELEEKRKQKEEQKRKQIDSQMLYLLDERKRVIEEIKEKQKNESSEMNKFQKEKNDLKRIYGSIDGEGILYIPAKSDSARDYKHAVRNILRKNSDNRAARVDKRFMNNIGRYVNLLELKAARDKDSLNNLESNISYWNKKLESLANEICKFTKDEILGSTESIRKYASTQIAIKRSEVKKIQASIKKSEQELLTLKQTANVSLEKAKSLRAKMGNTLESFISYLERLKKQKAHEKLEDQMSDNLITFEKTRKSIEELEKLTKNVDSKLEEICDVVQNSSRSGLDASFDISRKRVNMVLKYTSFHTITLIEYLHYLKTQMRPNDVKKLEKSITEICLKITERIDSLSALDPDVESLRCKIEKYNKLLEEKKRMFK